MINILKLRKLEKEKITDKNLPAIEDNLSEIDIAQDNKPAETSVSFQVPVNASDNAETIKGEPEQKPKKKSPKKTKNDASKKKSLPKKSVEEPAQDFAVKEVIPLAEVKTESTSEVDELLGEINEIEKELIELQEKMYLEEKLEANEADPAEVFRANLLKELLAEESSPNAEAKDTVKTEGIEIPVELKEKEEILKPLEVVKPAETGKIAEVIKPVEIAKPIEFVKPVEIPQPVIAKLPNNEKNFAEQAEIANPVAKYINTPQEEKPLRQISEVISSIKQDESLIKGDVKKKNNENIVQLVGFMLSNEYYGVDITKIREIIRMVDITRVPRAPHFIEGVINLRGTVIPVINLRTKVRMPRLEYDKNTRIVIVEIKGTIIGFIVDAVREVLRIHENNLEAPPAITIEKADYITSVAKLEDQLVILMDTEKVLSNEEGKLLGNMIKN